jgi:ribonucleoside-triphosphate reductase (formate)
MGIKVQKRDGRDVEFDPRLIYTAIFKAAKSCNYVDDECHSISTLTQEKVLSKIKGEVVTVEEIQDLVEKTFMVSKYKGIAKEFITYRHERSRVRDEKSSYVKMGLDILDGSDIESQRENSNVPRDSMLTKLEIIKRSYHKKIANDFILPEKYKYAHDSGDIHIHDCDAIVSKFFNCCLMDYPFMFENGFQLGNKFIEKPNTILTAMNVLVQMVQVQSNLQFGGLTLADVDVHLGQFVEGSYNKYIEDALEDLETEVITDKIKRIALKKTKRDVYRACKLLSYQLNTLQVRGESSPFVTITYGQSTTPFGRMIQECILQERLDEFDKSGVQAFPKHQFITKIGINLAPEDPNYDIFKLANRTSARTCYPDYIFPDNQLKHTGGSASYMGCRSLLHPWTDENSELKYLGRANTGVVSLNLPRIAMESNSQKMFFDILSERLDLAIDICKWRYKRLINTKAKDAEFTYLGGVLGIKFDPEESVEKAFGNGRASLSIGYIGLHEVGLHLFGKEVTESLEVFNFHKNLLSFINERLTKEKDETGLAFSIYSTPSESLTDRFCKLDREKFGSIKGITDKGFYINSYHVNTETVISPFEKINIESELQPLTKGGHISYIESHNLSNNLTAYETFVRYAHDKGLMHFAINSGWDFCKTCHWTGELEVSEDTNHKYTCPSCGEDNPDKVNLTRRLCGYVTEMGKRPPVEGRVKEIMSRVKHNKN